MSKKKDWKDPKDYLIEAYTNKLINDYKQDDEKEQERQRQRALSSPSTSNSTNSPTSSQNSPQTSSRVSQSTPAERDLFKMASRKFTDRLNRATARDNGTGNTNKTRTLDRINEKAYNRYDTEGAEKSNIRKNFEKDRAEFRKEHPVGRWLGAEGNNALWGFDAELAKGADFFLPDVITPKKIQQGLDYYKKQGEEAQKTVEKERGGSVERTILGTVGGESLKNIPSATMAYLSGGASVGAQVAGKAVPSLYKASELTHVGNTFTRALNEVAQTTGKNPMFWETFARTIGTTYENELENGADPVRATLSAYTNALLNAQIEVGGGIEVYDPSEDFLKAVARSAKEEGLEEVEQYAVENLVNKAMGSNTAKWFSLTRGQDAVVNPVDMAEQGFYGAMAGGLLSGGRTALANTRADIMETLANPVSQEAVQEGMADQRGLVNRGLVQDRGEEVSTKAKSIAQELQAQLDKGEELQPNQVKRLIREINKESRVNEQSLERAKIKEVGKSLDEGTFVEETGLNLEQQISKQKDSALESRSKEKVKAILGENASDNEVASVTKVVIGTANSRDIDTVLTKPALKNAVADMVNEGADADSKIQIPINNAEARTVLENLTAVKGIANRNAILKETQEENDEDIKALLTNLNSGGKDLFANNLARGTEAIGDVYQNRFYRMYNEGRKDGADFEEAYNRLIAPLGGDVQAVFTRDFAQQIFAQGKASLATDNAKETAKSRAEEYANRKGGLTFENNNENLISSRERDELQKFAERVGVEINVVKSLSKDASGKALMSRTGKKLVVNGKYQDGVITIASDAQNKLITVAKHELTHYIKEMSPERYKELEDFVLKKWYKNDPVAMAKRIEEYQRLYKDATPEEAREELIADASEAFFTDEGAIQDAISFSEKLGRAIHDGIKTMLDAFLGLQDADSRRMRGYGGFLKDLGILQEAERMWLEALEDTQQRKRNARGNATAEDYVDASTQYTTSDEKHSLVESDDEIERLNSEPTQKSYRAMALIDGKLYPPMATKVKDKNGKWVLQQGADIGQWLKSDITTDPKMFNSNGQFILKKDNDDTIPASYNPYIHSSDTMLNDQFATAYKRPNIVVVEGEIPTSELTNGKRAEHDLDDGRHIKAKDPTGTIQWKAGIVQGKLTGTRTVFLTNHFKPTRVVPDSEVARSIQDMVKGTDVAIPYNVVTPSLRQELQKLGVKMEQSKQKGYQVDLNAKYSVTAEEDQAYMDAVNRGDMETAQRMVDEEAKRNGYNIKVFHGTPNETISASRGRIRGDDYKKLATDYADKLFPYVVFRNNGRLTGIYTSTDRGIADAFSYSFSRQGTVYDLYARADKPFTFDAEGNGWNNIPINAVEDLGISKAGRITLEDVSRSAKEQGYDAVVVNNVRETGSGDNESPLTTDVIVFSSTQLKSADPVTYDDKGNAIPLSERFNENNEDIRYSVSEDSDGNKLSEGQREYFGNSKIVDSKGNLKVMYHGSPNDFDTFDIKRAKAGLYGRGFYFTEDKSRASQYGKTYGVYLDIETPLQTGTHDITKAQLKNFIKVLAEDEDYGIENYGYGATVDSVLKSIWGKDDFAMLQDLNATAVGDFAEAVKLFNKVNGTSYDGIVAPTETIAFYPEQIKETSNKKPTKNPNMKFSVTEPVEETKDLLAVHNLKAEDLRGALDLGGFPMPSIAIIKADAGHNAYGEYSAVFDKSTIDPSVTKKNVVYGGDAWTPTFPRMQYKANDRVSKKISQLYYDRSRDLGYEVMKPLQKLANEPNDELDSVGGEAELKEAYKKNKKMMRMFLRMNNNDVEDVVNRTEDTLNDVEIRRRQHFIDALGEDAIREFEGKNVPNGSEKAKHRIEWAKLHKAEIENAYADYMKKEYDFTDEDVKEVLADTKFIELMNFIRDAMNYLNNGATTVRESIDQEATDKAVEQRAKAEGYDKWVDDLLNGIEEKRGIRNNKDYFTSSGNRRSWEALHDEPTLLKIVQIMSAQDNGETFLGSSLKAVAQKQYRNISEVRADKGRLKTISEEEYKTLMDGFAERENDIITRIDNASPTYESNPFIRHADIRSSIVDNVRRGLSKTAFLKDLQKYANTKGATAKDVDDIFDLVRDVANIPTGYFEAKPKRPVTFYEVKALLAPSDAPTDLISRLQDEGVNVVQYEAGNDEDRVAKLNQASEESNLKFSVSEEDENAPTQKEYQSTIAKLEEKVADLKSEFKRTDLKTADPKQTRIQAGRLLKRHDSNLTIQDDVVDAFGKIHRLYKEKGIDAFEEASQIALDTAKQVVSGIAIIHDEGAEQQKEIREFLKDNEIIISPYIEKNMDDFASFRKKNAFRLKLKKGEVSNLDKYIYPRLQELFPTAFPDEYYKANNKEGGENTDVLVDMLRHIGDVLDNPMYEIETIDELTPEWKEYVSDIASDIMETAYGLQTKKTFADKKYEEKVRAVAKAREEALASRDRALAKQAERYETKISYLKQRNKDFKEETRERYEARINDLKEQQKERERKTKERREEAERKQKEHRKQVHERASARRRASEERARQERQEQREARREKKQDSEARTRLLNIARRLDRIKGTDEFNRIRDQLIGNLDLEAKSMTGKTKMKLEDLEKWYQDQVENNDWFVKNERLEKKFERLRKTHISDMSLEDVQNLTEILLMLEHKVRNDKKLINSQYKKDVFMASFETAEGIKQSKGLKFKGLHKVDNIFIGQVLSPIRYMRRLTGYDEDNPLMIATRELQKGEIASLDYRRRALEPFLKFTDMKFTSYLNGNKAPEIEVNATTIDMKPTTVKITPAIRIWFYLSSMNADNMRHIVNGGVRIPDVKLLKKGKRTDAYDNGTLVRFSKSQVQAIIDGMTSKEEAYAKAVFNYFNKVAPEATNAVSETLDGISIAKVKNYVPIHVDDTFLDVEGDTIKMDGTVEGMGSHKERVQSSKPAYAEDVSDLLMRSIDADMKYVGMAIPLRNFGKIYRSSSMESARGQAEHIELTGETNNSPSTLVYGDEQTATYRTRTGGYVSVRDAIRSLWTSDATKYIDKFLSDLQFPHSQVGEVERTLRELTSNYAGAVLTLNASVAIKQSASYPTAGAVLGWKPLIKAFTKVGKLDLDYANSVTPLLAYRAEGFNFREAGDIQNRDGRDSWFKRIMRTPLFNWIQGMDLLTTRKLFKASEIYVQDKYHLKRGQSGYDEKVAEIFNKVITETQPNYTVMERAGHLRSDSTLERTLSMFKTQPYQNFNIWYDATGDYLDKRDAYKKAKTKANREALKEASVNLGNATTSQIAQLAVFAMMTSLWALARGKDDKWRDEEGNLSFASYLKQLAHDMIGGVASEFFLGSDVFSALDSVINDSYYSGFSSVTDSSINDFFNTGMDMTKLLQQAWDYAVKGNEEEIDTDKLLKQMEKVVTEGGRFSGIPTGNLINLKNLMYRWVCVSKDGEYIGEYEALKASFAKDSYKKDILMKAYRNDTTAYNKLRKMMIEDGFKESSLDEYINEQKKENKSESEQKAYDNSIATLERSSLWYNASRGDKDRYMKVVEKLAVGIEDSTTKPYTSRAVDGITEEQVILYKLALDKVDKPNKNGNLGSYDKDDKEEALKLLEREYNFTQKQKDDFINGKW